jgi:hypothetical protein
MNLRSSRVRERLGLAVEHLATVDRKLVERVLDAYEDHLSSLLSKDFPDQKTREAFEAIEALVRGMWSNVERKSAAYESALRRRVRPIEIAKRTLDYRVARRLAKLIVSLYFNVEECVLDEYEGELDFLRTPTT